MKRDIAAFQYTFTTPVVMGHPTLFTPKAFKGPDGKEKGEANYIDGVLEGADESNVDALTGESGGEADPLYDQAVAIVLENKRPSISLVQRHLRIGYNRAARLLEDMEKAGLVSKMGNGGNREILHRPSE